MPSQVLVTQLEAKKHGYADVVYLDAKTDTYLEEVSSCNVFCVKGKTIRTPPLSGTILPGVTRRYDLVAHDTYVLMQRTSEWCRVYTCPPPGCSLLLAGMAGYAAHNVIHMHSPYL